MLTVVCIVAFTSGIQNVPLIAQIPLIWISLFATLGIFIYYVFSNKKSIENSLTVNMKVFLTSTYLLMGLSFTSFYFYLTTLANLSMLNSLTFACISVMIAFAVNNYILNLTKKAIDGETEERKSKLGIFYRISRKNRFFNLFLVVFLADVPIVVGSIINENTGTMIYWTIGFLLFFGIWLQNAMREDLALQLEIGLIDKRKIKQMLKKLA
jgi:hypothetical protein